MRVLAMESHVTEASLLHSGHVPEAVRAVRTVLAHLLV